MVQRCYNHNCPEFYRYGGRGIQICWEWRNDSASFIYWAIDSGWAKGLQLDRMDNDGDYSPGNCRFVSATENCRNRRTNHLLTIGGVTHCIAKWSEISGVKPVTIRWRLRRGWSPSDAVNTPLWSKP